MYYCIDESLSPEDRLFAAVIRLALRDACGPVQRHRDPARAFLQELDIPLDVAGTVPPAWVASWGRDMPYTHAGMD